MNSSQKRARLVGFYFFIHCGSLELLDFLLQYIVFNLKNGIFFFVILRCLNVV